MEYSNNRLRPPEDSGEIRDIWDAACLMGDPGAAESKFVGGDLITRTNADGFCPLGGKHSNYSVWVMQHQLLDVPREVGSLPLLPVSPQGLD